MRLLQLAVLIFSALLAMPASAQITLTRGANLSVDAAADGRLVTDLLGDLWIVPGLGGEARQLTQNLKSVQRPRWSPDASMLVYQANNNGRHGIWLYDFATRTSKIISADFFWEAYPSWHPSNERILYSSDRSGNGFDLWEIDLATGLRWRLSQRPGDETEAAWSADGRDLVYVSRLAQQWSLVLRRHGRPEEILLTSLDPLSAPSWRPDGSLITYFRKAAMQTTMEMAILSQPRIVRTYATNESFVATPVSWIDRQRMIYSANGGIRQRFFNSWTSTALEFRATIQPEPQNLVRRERPDLPWTGEPPGELVIRASQMFDGVNIGYQYNKDIVISGGRVSAVEDVADRSGMIVIDMGDLTIIPGFIDADARLPSKLAASHGPDLLAMGVTTLVGQHPDLDRLNSLWSGSDVPGPRLLSTDQWQIGELSRPEQDATAAIVTSRSMGQSAGASLAAQFRSMALAGLTPEQTLKAVGVNAAAAMLADPYLGRISTGAAADLVFVHGDPLADVASALNVVAIVRNGRFYSVSGLIDRAKSAENVE